MKLGRVLTYKDLDEAKRLIGKKVVNSDNFKYLETRPDKWLKPTILTGINEGDSCYYPFKLLDGSVVQFIREVIEDEPDPHYEPYDLSDPKTFDIEVVGYYEPYDLSDPKVRDSLRGEWFRDIQEDDDTPERMVTSFECNEDGDEWCVNGIYTASTFLRDCVWLDDGTPCGRRMDKEMSSPVLTRDGKEDEK